MSTTIPQNLASESIRLLQGLLRCDTQSPPGNEIRAAEFIRGELDAHGIESEILESAPGRASLVARLRSDNPTAKPIMLMGHIDVVTVERDKWERDPFGGEIDEDGFIWGRGALDMKSKVAGSLASFIALKESGLKLNRDVIFMAAADEEAGGRFGADWLWKNHQGKIDAEFAINEGGGQPVEIGGKRFYLCQAGEKGSSALRLVVKGTPGHASMPIDGTAMQKLGDALDRLHAWQHPTVITSSVRLMLTSIGDAIGGETKAQIDTVLAQESPDWSELAALPIPEANRRTLFAITRNTSVPTMINGGQQINVIPGEISINVDCRLLPGQDPGTFLAEAQAVIGDVAEVSFLYEKNDSGIEADPASPFFDAIKQAMAELDPEGTVIPALISGGTDAALVPGVKVYGFFPFPLSERLPMYRPLVHGHNERIHQDDQVFGTEFVYRLITNVAGIHE